jgi:hypothetical protein
VAVTREELYQLVWSEPMIRAAERFGVSGSYLARVCGILSVPRPERGYWAKLAVGKAPPVPPLPAARPGDPVEWSKDDGLQSASPARNPLPVPPVLPALPPIRRRAAKAVRVTTPHALIRGARTHFETGRPVDEGAYLRPYKKLLVDITTSKAELGRALALASDLFNALESAGYRVTLAHQGEPFTRSHPDVYELPRKRQDHGSSVWSPVRPTVVYVGTVAIGLALIEMSDSVLLRYVNGKYIRDADYIPPRPSRRFVDHTWTTTRDLPCGRFRLIAYAPWWHVSWSNQWQETGKTPLDSQIPAIVKAMRGIAGELAERVREADHQAELARQTRLVEEEQRRRAEDQRRVRASVKESREHLDQIIRAWSDVKNLERFFQGVGEHATRLDVADRETVLLRLSLAREFIGTQDPLEFFLAWKTPGERYKPLYPYEASEEE